MWKVAAWNVNSVKARLDRLLGFLEREQPDVVLLQELKCEEPGFPYEAVGNLGYSAAVSGQKAYNGVAILSREPALDISRGIGFSDKEDARWIAATVQGVRVASVYVPNGQAVGSEKYAYKLEWLKKLREHLDRTESAQKRLLIGGDFNIAPEDRDVHDPAAWRGQILFSEPEKAALQKVCEFGLADTFRKHHNELGHYSWWDYRMLGFPKNRGLRIDFLFATPALWEHCSAARIDRDERKGTLPSDHAPVIAEFASLG